MTKSVIITAYHYPEGDRHHYNHYSSDILATSTIEIAIERYANGEDGFKIGRHTYWRDGDVDMSFTKVTREEWKAKMKRKRYYFNNDSWIDSPACDCCQFEGLMECYNLDNDKHPDIVQNGSSHSLERCYEQVLQWEGVCDEQEWREGMHAEEALLYLEGLMIDNNLQVEIERTHYEDSCAGVYP